VLAALLALDDLLGDQPLAFELRELEAGQRVEGGQGLVDLQQLRPLLGGIPGRVRQRHHRHAPLLQLLQRLQHARIRLEVLAARLGERHLGRLDDELVEAVELGELLEDRRLLQHVRVLVGLVLLVDRLQRLDDLDAGEGGRPADSLHHRLHRGHDVEGPRIQRVVHVGDDRADDGYYQRQYDQQPQYNQQYQSQQPTYQQPGIAVGEPRPDGYQGDRRGHYEQRVVQQWVPGRYQQVWVPEQCNTRFRQRGWYRSAANVCVPAHYAQQWMPGHYESTQQSVWVPYSFHNHHQWGRGTFGRGI